VLALLIDKYFLVVCIGVYWVLYTKPYNAYNMPNSGSKTELAPMNREGMGMYEGALPKARSKSVSVLPNHRLEKRVVSAKGLLPWPPQ
jgi:uncharacterized membrane protein